MYYVAVVNALQKENGLKLFMILHEWIMCLCQRFVQVIWLNAIGERKKKVEYFLNRPCTSLSITIFFTLMRYE